jgi:hypothetical protein
MTTIPNTIAPSESTRKAPRTLGGEISLMYIGAVEERRPIPIPPMKRPTTSWANWKEVVWMILPMTNHTRPRPKHGEISCAFLHYKIVLVDSPIDALREYLSAKKPARRAPINAPSSSRAVMTLNHKSSQ